MNVGDLVRCKDGNHVFAEIDGGLGIVIQAEKYAHTDFLSVEVQWATDSLWYEDGDLEILSER